MAGGGIILLGTTLIPLLSGLFYDPMLAARSVSPCFQYSVQSLGRDRFRFISPYTTARLDKRQKIFFHTDIVLPPFC